MKCKSCGANLRMEDEFCPNCGTVNSDAVRQSQDMQESVKAQRDVYHTAESSVPISNRAKVIVVLAGLWLLLIILNLSDVGDSIKHKQIASRIEEHLAKLEELESAGEYHALYEYYSANRLYSFDETKDFYRVYYASECYTDIEIRLCRLIMRDELNFDTSDTEREIWYLCDSVEKLYERSVRDPHDSDERWSPEHTAAINDMKAEANLLLMTYCNISEEDMAVFETAGIVRKQILIEEGLGLYEE